LVSKGLPLLASFNGWLLILEIEDVDSGVVAAFIVSRKDSWSVS